MKSKILLIALLLLPSVALAQPVPGNTDTVYQGTSPWVTSGTATVSGTVAATQSGPWTNACTQGGTWTVQPGNTANTTAWKVDGSAVTQPVSGTVAVTQSTSPWVTSGTSTVTQGTSPWVTSGTATVSGTVAATQSGTWTVQPGNTANTTAWKVDGSAVTQPVSGTVAVTQSTSPWVVSGSVTGGMPTASAVSAESVVSVGDTSTSVLALNASRKGGWVKNISVSDIYVSFSGTATLVKPTLLEPGDALSLGQTGTVVYTGAVSAIHAVAGQSRSLEVVEF